MNALYRVEKASSLRVFAWVAAVALEAFRPQFPKMVRIETTNHCNANCGFCPRASMGREKGFMDQGLYEKIIDQCSEGGCSVLHLHNFGEPLLDKQLPQRIRFAKDKGIGFVKIFTNGSLLCDSTAEALLNSGLDEIKISMDGADAVEFNRLRSGLDHGRILQNIKDFRKMRDLNGFKHPIITATCVQTSDRKKTREMLRGVVDRLVFADLHNWGGEGGLSRKRTIRQPCARLWQTFTILFTGDVALCCMDYAGKVILGHCSHEKIANIWEGPLYRNVRKKHRDSEQRELSVCNECSMSFFPPTLSIYRSNG
jgi:sulfatase maturation enzyme AslB (radical SAM superfamily)